MQGVLALDRVTVRDADFSRAAFERFAPNGCVFERCDFRGELFDVFNHPNFGNPVLTATSGSFGKIQGTRFPTGDFGSARQILFALKLLF